MINKGLNEISLYLPEINIKLENSHLYSKLSIRLENIILNKPLKSTNSFIKGTYDTRLFPWECRITSSSYNANLNADLIIKYDNSEEKKLNVMLSSIPIMVGSDCCNLFHNINAQTAILRREDFLEYGG